MKLQERTELRKAYESTTVEEIASVYDDWADEYDSHPGRYIHPELLAHVWPKYVSLSEPSLDVACGTGLHIETLRILGYHHFTGIDVSTKMLSRAHDKELYEKLVLCSADNMPFKDNEFGSSMAIGALAPGHVPWTALREIFRVTSNYFIFTITEIPNEKNSQTYLDEMNRLGGENVWSSRPYAPMPHSASDVRAQMHVYRVKS